MKILKKYIAGILLGGCLYSMGAASVQGEAFSQGAAADAAIYIRGYEWGPGVSGVIIELDREISRIEQAECRIFTKGEERKIKDLFLSNEKGEREEGPSVYITAELETTYEDSGSPFSYDAGTRHNQWREVYEVAAVGWIQEGEEKIPIDFQKDCIDQRVCPDTEMFGFRMEYGGTYENPATGDREELTLQLAAYEPEHLEGGKKNPLIIWLHGQGEGGTDPDIVLLGNETTALAKEEIQLCFHSGEETGAYVLVLQTPTYWMDEGDGGNGDGSGSSRYGEILMDGIKAYVEKRPDIDTSRIYIGGCSNGGYMTMNMLVQEPDYFAAAFPVCEAYSAKELKGLKDKPVWFVTSMNDTVVDPMEFTVPAYRELREAGADNVWLSAFETVTGKDDEGTSYLGHWSWIRLFNGEVTRVQNPEQTEIFPSDRGGGSTTAGDHQNIFQWLNAQSGLKIR